MSIYKKKRKRGDLVKDKANAFVIVKQVTFRDLKKRVSLETTHVKRLHNKPFWIWNIEEHKQE